MTCLKIEPLYIALFLFRLLGVEFQFNDVVSLIMEHIPGEPLDKYIFRCRTLDEPTIKLFTKQTVEAIDYMHSKFVMHRYGVALFSKRLIFWCPIKR